MDDIDVDKYQSQTKENTVHISQLNIVLDILKMMKSDLYA